jgi:hypothetical protein
MDMEYPTAFVRLRSGRLVEVPPAVLSLPRPKLDTWLETEKGIPIPDDASLPAPPKTPFTDEQLDRWIAENAKLPATGTIGYWCKHCSKLVTIDHTRLTPLPLWKLLLQLKDHSLPRRGRERRELTEQFKEMAKRFVHQTNIQTVLFIWNAGVVRTIKWDGHEKKWVKDMEKPKPKKVVVKVVKKKNKKKVKKRVRRKNRKRCKGCNTLFSPTGRQIFCNPRCKAKSWQKVYRKRKREE